MRPLPYHCTCTNDKFEKIDKYVSQFLREMELLKAVMRGFTPKMRAEYFDENGKLIRLDEYKPQIWNRDDYDYVLYLENLPVIPKATIILTLFDINNQPLYCRKYYFGDKGSLTVYWSIGFSKEKYGDCVGGEKYE
jgi:hypothetical protein